jgi:hypothetical protein
MSFISSKNENKSQIIKTYYITNIIIITSIKTMEFIFKKSYLLTLEY